MSWHDKIIWTEGMFLRPQHFQQQDRYVQQLVDGRCDGLRPYGWGFTELELDSALLLQGKLALAACRGVLPDGTPFACNTADDLPPVLEIPEGVSDQIVYLALPLRRPGAVEIQNDASPDGIGRYRVREHDARDSSSGAGDGPAAQVQVGALALRLVLDAEDLQEYSHLGVARIVEQRADKSVVLDDRFIPPCLDTRASPRLTAFVNEIVGLLNYRGEALAGRVTEGGRGGVAEFADFLILMLVNRFQPLFQHLTNLNTLHPELLYEICVQLAGELATFTSENRRASEFPPYRQDALAETWLPVMDEIRGSLQMVIEQNAIPTSEWLASLRKTKDFGVAIGANCQSVVNPLVDVSAWLGSAVDNYAQYEDPVLEDLFDKMNKEGDPEKQREYMRKFEHRAVNEMAHLAVTLWWYKINPHRSYVKGWKIAPSHYLNQHLDQVWLDK